MTSEETAPVTPGDGESVSAGRRAASVAGGKAAPAADFDSMIGSADGASADHAAGAAGSDDVAGPGEGSGSGGTDSCRGRFLLNNGLLPKSLFPSPRKDFVKQSSMRKPKP